MERLRVSLQHRRRAVLRRTFVSCMVPFRNIHPTAYPSSGETAGLGVADARDYE
jgi:hypothetical protein